MAGKEGISMLRHRSVLRVAALLLIFLSNSRSSLLAQEQVPSSDRKPPGIQLGEEHGALTITGNIIDETGSGVAAPNVRVVVTNLNTNSSRSTLADSSGHFTMIAVPPGRYHIRAIVPGFTVKEKDIEVSLNSLNAVTLTVRKGISQTSQPTQTTSVVPDSEVPAGCPVTKLAAHSFIPPMPYPSQTDVFQTDEFWFGSEKLWTMLPKNGMWKGLSHYRPTDTAFKQKLFWWRKDFRGDAQSMLRVTGKRLDSPTPSFVTDQHAYASWTDDPKHPFITAGIDIPTLGCWQITGRFKDAELTFVIWVTQ